MKQLAKANSFMEVLAILIGLEQAAREQRALERLLSRMRLTLQSVDSVQPDR